MILRNTLVGAALAAALAVLPATAEAGHDGDVVAGAALGALGGFLLGQTLAPQPLYAAPPVYVPQEPVHLPARPVYGRPLVRYVDQQAAHVSWCESQYRSYSYEDNTFIDRRGRVRVCSSPYGY